MKRKLLATATIMTLSLSFASCGTSNTSETSTTTTETTTESTQTSETETPTQEVTNTETVTVSSVKGDVEIPATPQRMVDLSGSSDMLELLGYDIIGTANSDAYDYTKFPSYLEDTLEGSTILGYSMVAEMDVEAVIALEPDVIVISTVQEKMYDQLSQIAPVVMIELEGVDWKDDFEYVAETFHKEDIYNSWMTAYQTKAEEIGNEIEATYGEETSYLSFLASGESLFLFADAGIGQILYDDLGLDEPVGMPEQQDISLPVVTIEGLAEIGSDYLIVLATEEDKANLEANPIFTNLAPVKNGKYIILPSSPFFNQGYSPIGSDLFLDQIQSMLDGTYEQ